MLLIFNRKVIPDPKIKDAATVECKVEGQIEGKRHDLGTLKFPSKQSWSLFYGALQQGSLKIKRDEGVEVKIENVPVEAPPTKAA